MFGCYRIYLLGCLFQAVLTFSCGLSRTAVQLIVFRGIAGVAQAMCLPSAVSLITNAFRTGKSRNIAFACMGSGQPIGFSIGLTLGGVFADTIGWRWGFHITAIVNTVVFIVAVRWLPRNSQPEGATWERFWVEVDWIGALLASSALAMISYVFA